MLYAVWRQEILPFSTIMTRTAGPISHRGEQMTEKVRSLGQRQVRFIDAIISGKNRTDAYINTGYKTRNRRSAAAAAARLYANDNVQREFQRRREMASHHNTYHLIRLSQDALEKLGRIIQDCQNERVTLEAIKTVLEYAGLRSEQEPKQDDDAAVSFKDVILGLGQRNEAIAEEYWYAGSDKD